VPDTPLWFRPVAWLLDGQPVDDEVVAAAFGGQPADLGRLRGFELCVVVRVGVSAPKHVGFAVRGDALWIDRYARVTQRWDRFCWDYDTEVSAGRADSGSNSGPTTPVSGDTRVTVVWFHRRSRGLRIAGAVLLMPLAVAADAVGAAVVVSLLFVVGSLPCDDDDDDDR
jgi:hypothetical protein